MDKISVCYLSFNYYPGQGVTAFYEFSRKMRDKGHKIYVIAAARSDEKTFEVLDGIVIIRIPVKTTRKRSLESLRFNLIASRFIANIPDLNIVHIFSYSFSFLVKLGSFYTSNKIKWVYDIRSGPLENKNTSSKIYKLVKFLIILESSLFNITFVISNELKNHIFGHNARKTVFIIPTGVDLNIFKKNINNNLLKENYIKGKDIILVYLGSLSHRRRLKNLILAFSKSSMKIVNLKLFIIGNGDNIKYLKMLSKRLSISEKIYFIGYIDYFEVPKYISIADIAISYIPIIPSYDAQPPTKTIEYLACSLPVIATNTKGNQRFIVNGENGLLVGDDPDSVSKAIILLCEDIDFRKKLVKNTRSSIIEYDWRTIVEKKLLPAYIELLRN